QGLDPSLRTQAQLDALKVFSLLLPAFVPGFPAGLHLDQLSIPFVYAQGFGDARLITPAILFSAYVQDDIKPRPNLLIKAGVRYDINRARYIPDNNGNISPRIAVSYRPERLQRVNLRASYGLFFGPPILGTQIAVERTSTGAFKLAVFPFPFSIVA